MQLGFTRDSKLLWLAFATALVTYLAGVAKFPTEWTYGEWLSFAGFALAWLSGKLDTSPLPHSEEGYRKITPSGR